MMTTRSLWLASASPRRADLLRQIGVPFSRLAPPSIDETPAEGEAPGDYVLRMAREKAATGWARLRDREEAAVLGADTAVVLGDGILGKPADRDHARHMLEQLCGAEHRVLSAVSVITQASHETRLAETLVRVRADARDQIDAYLDTGEPMDKAGAYAIQGFGAVLVDYIAGSYSAVVGLPLVETRQLLAGAGVAWWQLTGTRD